MTKQTLPAGDNVRPLISTDELAVDYRDDPISVLEMRARECPAVIEDDATYGTWQDLLADLNSETKKLEGLRVTVKDPFLRACGTVDGFFNGLKQRVAQAGGPVTSVCRAYMQRKADAERRKREEEARKLREEQERREAEARVAQERADKLKREGLKQQAQEQADLAAREANRLANEATAREEQARAKSADLGRTRSATGTLGSLKDTWAFEILDIDAIKGAPLWPYIPRAVKETAIGAWLKANAPKELSENEEWQPMKGVRFYRTSKLQVRR
jgi:flagellar biosynthesis GTPase FlhF